MTTNHKVTKASKSDEYFQEIQNTSMVVGRVYQMYGSPESYFAYIEHSASNGKYYFLDIYNLSNRAAEPIKMVCFTGEYIAEIRLGRS